MKTRVLSLFIAAALAAGASVAAEAKEPAAAAEKREAARAEIDRLVARIEELSHQLGDDGVKVIVRRGRGGPEWEGRELPKHFEFHDEDGDGPRKVRIERLGPGEAPRALPPGSKWELQLPKSGSGTGLGIVLSALGCRIPPD